MTIKSKVMEDSFWKIKKSLNNGKLTCLLLMIEQDCNYIANYNPVVYCNDLTGESWCFDTKLPSGRWLENITMVTDSDGVNRFSAIVS